MENLMKRISCGLPVLAALGVLGAAPAAFADNLLGLYVGAGVGQSSVRSDDYDFGYREHFSDHHFAWKGIIGIRPISLVGAEFEYIDFGHPGGDSDDYYYDAYSGPDTHPRAAALFAVGYLPIPLPFIDIYGKAGVARLHMNVDRYAGDGGTYRTTVNDTDFAYGAGVQSKIYGLTLRAEYERINSSYGDPDMVSVSATWTF
jgi:Outer membrane protein beta-barrel domain